MILHCVPLYRYVPRAITVPTSMSNPIPMPRARRSNSTFKTPSPSRVPGIRSMGMMMMCVRPRIRTFRKHGHHVASEDLECLEFVADIFPGIQTWRKCWGRSRYNRWMRIWSWRACRREPRSMGIREWDGVSEITPGSSASASTMTRYKAASRNRNPSSGRRSMQD